MIRNLLAIGTITGFIAMAFVTPTDANFQTMETIAKNQVRNQTVGSLLGGTSLSANDATAAANILSAVATNPALKSAATKAIGSTSSLEHVQEAATVLTSVSSPVKTAKKIVKTSVQVSTTHRMTHTWKNFKSSADPFMVEQMQRIEWALKKNDVRLCSDVFDAVEPQSPSALLPATAGEYLSLCIAIVTGNPMRCDQILTHPDSSLHTLCTDELAAF